MKNNLYHILNKPFSFQGKTIQFFGDSITMGHTSGVTLTENGFPKLFCEHVGAHCENHALSGALFTHGYNEIKTILEQLQSTPLNSDFMIIAGGTNDFGLGAPIHEFKAALLQVMLYLKDNYHGHVIFIAPINRISAPNNSITELDKYRKVICEYCISFEYDFINGGLFHFPEESCELLALVMTDGLHPSEHGYRLYAKDLAGILC